MQEEITFRLNGEYVRAPAQEGGHLADLLRHHFRLTATHLGCEHGVCGACNVRIDGQVARACLTLAAQVEGTEISTLEGLQDDRVICALQEEFVARNALQCGFCTPGMLMTAAELLAQDPSPDRVAIREALSGNFCRCTGYHAIVDAVEAAAASLREAADV
jgi:aerobic-type carbon monoxide dehydrogenase small subunit (CoxS/CutS family)